MIESMRQVLKLILNKTTLIVVKRIKTDLYKYMYRISKIYNIKNSTVVIKKY
jgi:hypothetical protein